MTEQYTAADRRALIMATCLATILTPLMSTMMNLSLLSIGSEFGVGSHALAYVNTLFLLGSVVSMVPSAKYASIHGMKRVSLIGLSIVIVACILSMVSPGFYFLLIMRFVIGLGCAMLMVTSMAMITYVFPLTVRGKMLGLNTTFVYIGLSLGPTIGGVLTDTLGWRSIFATILLMGAGAFLLMTRFRKEVVPTPGDGMDWMGSAMWGMMITVLMLGFINITEWWGPALTVLGFVLLFAVWRQLRASGKPVLDVRMFHNRLFTRTCLAAFMNYGASYCITFFLALYLQSVGQMTAIEAGTLMLVQPFIQVLLTMKMGALSDRMENKRFLPFLGAVITGIGVAMYLLVTTEFNMYLIIAIMITTGVGLGIFSAPNNSLIMSSVPNHLKGQASGMVAVVRQTGMMISMSLAMASIAVMMGSMDNLSPATFGTFVDAMHVTFAVCLGMCILSAVCSLSKIEAGYELS